MPLNTVELQKLASRKLRIGAHRTMQVAEELYNKGFISYPRTETDKFNFSDDELHQIVQGQTGDPTWGNYAQSLLSEDKYHTPRRGQQDDKAHPPIHPIRALGNDTLSHDEQSIYELVIRHFLACCSDDAIGNETVTSIDIQGEEFTCKGLMITDLNWLNVYPYEKWSDKTIPVFNEREQFVPTSLMMCDGNTQPPPLLTEADLISLMDKNGIGTDATIAQHIQTIVEREYVLKKANVFEPTPLGLALVQGYDSMGFELAKPQLRAKMESDMLAISRGEMSKDQVLVQNLDMYKSVFVQVTRNAKKLDFALRQYYKSVGEAAAGKIITAQFSTCGCGALMSLKELSSDQQQTMRFLHCPQCNESHSLPPKNQLEPNDHICPLCNFQTITVRNVEKNTSHTLCPHCFGDPPELEDLATETFVHGFRCFNCTFKDCALAKQNNNNMHVVRTCPLCNSSPMTLTEQKTQKGKFFVGCKGFPHCRASIFLPPCTNVSVSDETCPVCSSQQQKENVHKLNFEFRVGQVPLHIPLQYVSCLFCDELDGSLKSLMGFNLSGGSSVGSKPTASSSSQARVMQRQEQVMLHVKPPVRKQNQTAQHSSRQTLPESGSSTESPPTCFCGILAKHLTCKKGANAGRAFYTCPKSQKEQQCKFFEWA